MKTSLALLMVAVTCGGADGLVRPANADVLTQRYNVERTGSTVSPGLNQGTVADPRWGEVGRVGVNGVVYAQPLVVERLERPGASPTDTVFVATGSNGLYAFDARSLKIIWAQPEIAPNDKSAIGSGCDNLSLPGGIGIEATPVIDRVRNAMFVSYRTNPSGLDRRGAQQRLRAVDIRDGHVLKDVLVAPPGATPDWAVWHRSRAGLLLDNGVVYIGFASRCEDPGQPMFNGRVLGFDATTLRQVAEFSPTAGQNVDGGGIWQGGGGLAADGQGSIYLTAGNRRICVDPAPVHACVDHAPPEATNLADSVVKLTPNISRAPDGTVSSVDLHVADSFTPYRRIWLDSQDLDLSAAGPVLLPETSYLIAAGKTGIVYLLDRGNMGELDEAHKWTGADVSQVPADMVQAESPDDPHADHVVQKFQAAFNQYVPTGSPDLPRAGAPIAAAVQNANQIDAFAVGRDGAVRAWWAVLGGPWTDRTLGRQGPAAITPAGLAPAMAHVVAAPQGNNQLDAFVVGNDGAIHIAWETGDGAWSLGAGGITPPNFAPPGAPVAAATQGADQLDVFIVGNDGAVHVAWVVGTGGWVNGTDGITPRGLSPPGASVAAAAQGADQLDVFTVSRDGAIHIAWVVGTTGGWVNGTGGITPVGLAPPGASVAAAPQGASQLDAFVVGNDGAIHIAWVVGTGGWSFGSGGITPPHLAPPGACVTAAHQNDNQLDVFVVGNDGAAYTTYVVGAGHWSDGTPPNQSPVRITPAGLSVPGSCVGPIKAGPGELDALVVGKNGAPWRTWEVNDGVWRDTPLIRDPLPLDQAVWMVNCWPCWPHIHGSPVFASFPDHRSLLYVWPEKDHLKAYAWLGDRVDAEHPVLGVAKQGGLVVAPPGPPFGMPGGMLAVAVDPGGPDRGLLLASVPRPEGNQMNGMLRVFDPVTLQEIWNNAGTDYMFSKFVPPTAAVGRVFLPTGSGYIIVYGLPRA
jgi:hypothetical protein